MNRSGLIREELEIDHYRYHAGLDSEAPASDWIRVNGSRISTDFEPGRIFAIGSEQFTNFLESCVGISRSEAPTEWQFSLDASLCRSGFLADIGSERIHIRGRTERDLTDAMHYLERGMADQGGPWLPPGLMEKFPSLVTRFTEGVFVPGHQTVENPGDFSPEYLGLMRHFGANALKMNVSLNDLWFSETLSELNTPDLDRSLVHLRRHADHLMAHGMDLFLILNAKALPSTHAVFLNHPEILGAREEIFLEELSGADRCVLCASHPLTLKAYGEAVENLFRRVPELAGGIMLVGGEGFHHCFMRPANPDKSGTNCPRCRGRDPHSHVAKLASTIATAVKRAGSEKRLIAWPYGAFIWSKDDPTESRWIGELEGGAEVQSNFDCGDADPTTGAGAVLFDYNIKIPGPSSCFAAQAELCRNRNIPILAKTETNTTPDTFFLPCLPVYFRWHARFQAIREAGCAGFMGQWRFYGMNGSISEELQYHSVWNPERGAEELLRTVARRDFGLTDAAADRLVDAWRTLSKAWDSFPYSAMTAGEREAYMRGPWYLGPAHPLIFNSQSSYELGPKFFLRRGDLAEMLKDEKLARLPGKPRYVCDLLLCLPFGVESYLRHACDCRDQWDRGLAEMEDILAGQNGALRRSQELNICRAISIHLHSLVNTVRFLERRDSLGSRPMSSQEFESCLRDLDGILGCEIENARRALPILQSDPRIGFGFTYGEVYDSVMVEQKIRQCEFVRNKELPRSGSVIRFHVWSQYP